MYSYGYFAFHVKENLIHFYVCVLKRFHLLLVPCELSIRIVLSLLIDACQLVIAVTPGGLCNVCR